MSFRDHDYVQMSVRLDPALTGAVSAGIAAAVKKAHKKRQRIASQASLSDNDSGSSPLGAASMSSDADDDGMGSPPLSPGFGGLGSLSKQSGFLQGFNRSTQMCGASSWGVDLDMNKGAMGQISESSTSTDGQGKPAA